MDPRNHGRNSTSASLQVCEPWGRGSAKEEQLACIELKEPKPPLFAFFFYQMGQSEFLRLLIACFSVIAKDCHAYRMTVSVRCSGHL